MNPSPNANNEENRRESEQIVTNVINKIINKSIPSSFSQTSGTSSCSPPITNDVILAIDAPKLKTTEIPQGPSVQTEPKPTLEIFRTGQFTESQSDIEVGHYADDTNRATTAPCVPPSYSTVIKEGRPSLDIRRDVRSMETQHISPFTRIPPPSYAEVHGVWSRDISNASSEQVLLGPDPIYIWCSHCATVVITVTTAERSKFTHFTAAALCLFGCWPCALLPYCMNSCKNIYHYCPDCNYLFGMYRPW